MDRFALIFSMTLLCSLAYAQNNDPPGVVLFPANHSKDVNPDTHLVITFPTTPTLGISGKISVYDASTDQLVDELDLSIPPGPAERDRTKVPYTEVPYVYIPGKRTNRNTKPGTPSGTALPTPDDYQLTIIGGFTDGFHFYPVIIRENKATIYLHHNLLDYGKTYYVQIDTGVLTQEGSGFEGIEGKDKWTFTTKSSPPPADTKRVVVSADGSGDFNTVQGAIDYYPDWNPERVTIFIKNGRYEEIVYFRNKENITILGEERDKVRVCYSNDEIFNPHPKNIATNHYPGTFPSRRAAFMVDASSGIHLVNFTIENIQDSPAQAEGLLLVGERHIVSHVTNIGSGDSLQVNGSAYFTHSSNTGWGHNILGRGPAFFHECDHISTFGPHMLVRNTEANHGYVFQRCKFRTTGNFDTTFSQVGAKSPNHAYVEAVLLNCSIENIRPHGWDINVDDDSDLKYWEYNTRNLADGSPADVSGRDPSSKQLTMEADAEIIEKYSNPTYVLGGWTPLMPPLILKHPDNLKISDSDTLRLEVAAAGVPEPEFQWFKNNEPIADATDSILVIEKSKAGDSGSYSVRVKNQVGEVMSHAARISIQ